MGRIEQPEEPSLDFRAGASERITEAAACLDGRLPDDPHDVSDLTAIEHPVVVDEIGRGRMTMVEHEAERRMEAPAPRVTERPQNAPEGPSQPQKRERSTALLDWIERHGGRG